MWSGNFQNLDRKLSVVSQFSKKMDHIHKQRVCSFCHKGSKLKQTCYLRCWVCDEKNWWQIFRIFYEEKALNRMIRWKIWQSLCQTFIVESFWFTSSSLRILPVRHVSNGFQNLKNVSQENIWYPTMFGSIRVNIEKNASTDQPSDQSLKGQQRQIEVHCNALGTLCKRWGPTSQMVVLWISKAGLALFINCSVLQPLLTWQQGLHQRGENVGRFYESGRVSTSTPSLSFWRVWEYTKFAHHHNLGQF